MFKRGLSHIEFVISFVIFIAFLVFAFMFFNPLESNRTLKSTSEYAWIELSDLAKAEAETYSISILGGYPPAINFEISGIPLNYNASAQDQNGGVIDVHR